MTPGSAAGFWPERAGEWAGLLADLSAVVIAVTLATLWLTGRNPIVPALLRRSRTRTVGAALGGGRRTRAVRRASREITERMLDGLHALTVADELAWLDRVAGGNGLATPVVLHGLGGSPHRDVQALSVAYRAFSRRLRSRGALGGGTAPVIGDAAVLAARTADLLAEHAAFVRPAPDAGSTVAFTAARGRHVFSLEPGTDDIAVSHVRERTVVGGTLMEELCRSDGVERRLVDLDPREHEVLLERMSGRFFDGALPSLRRAVRQRDPASGWTRLHLVLAETAYSAVVATQYVGGQGMGRPADRLRAEAALLTLSCLPITSDDRIVVARRSARVRTDPGRWGPGVNGNLEMRPRFGIAVDVDERGVPDPLRALAREAHEELGVDIVPSAIEVVGLARFDSDQQVDTSVLLTRTLIAATADEVVRASRSAHATEGRWELQGEFLAIPQPQDQEAEDELLAWTLTATDHQPHLTATLVAHCLPGLLDRLGGDVPAHLRALASGPAAPPPAGSALLTRE